MTTSASGALALELHLTAPDQWVATYYPMVGTPAGRWAEVTWVLHECPMPVTPDLVKAARWLEARSSDPDHPCYAGHRGWATQLAAGYTAALATYTAETSEATEAHLSAQETQRLQDSTFVVPAGQLSEWVLDDLKDEATDIRR
ncbi:hypothetical protein [Kocuria rosea]|uniref:hypothetical protein n=1 Tax=Kocuria rosea TaxID=1275 RepID=UPI000DFA03A7|nr:hypothetical protein [Kocuria rosea]STX05717.1 Uncharacterised protein [Kocuria rosea]